MRLSGMHPRFMIYYSRLQNRMQLHLSIQARPLVFTFSKTGGCFSPYDVRCGEKAVYGICRAEMRKAAETDKPRRKRSGPPGKPACVRAARREAGAGGARRARRARRGEAAAISDAVVLKGFAVLRPQVHCRDLAGFFRFFSLK